MSLVVIRGPIVYSIPLSIVAAVSFEQSSREIQDESSAIKGPAPGASFHSDPHRRLFDRYLQCEK
jgi:hypothetical protein